MTKQQINRLLQQAEQDSDILAAVEDDIIAWGGPEGQRLSLPLGKQLRKHSRDFERMPEGWLGATLSQHLMGRVFGREQLIKKFFVSSEAVRHSDAELEWCRSFHADPWWYMVYTVERQEAGELLWIRDVADGEQHLLCSRATVMLQREGHRVFLALVFRRGELLQTFSLIHSWVGLQPFDFQAYARVLDSACLRAHGLSRVVEQQLLAFLLLDLVATIPHMVFRGRELEYYTGAYRVSGFDPSDYELEGWKLEEKHGVLAIRPQPVEFPRDYVGLYYEKARKTLHIAADSVEQYRELVDFSLYELDAEPQLHFSQLMWVAMAMAGVKEPPLLDLLKHFSPEPELDEAEDEDDEGPVLSSDIDTINAFMNHMTECENNGVAFDLDQMAAEYGVDPQDAQNLFELLHRHDAMFSLGLEHGLKDFTPLPPAQRRRLQAVFSRCSLFSFSTDPALLRRFRPMLENIRERSKPVLKKLKRDLPPLGELPRVVDELFHNQFTQFGDTTFLNYTVYMLLKAGEQKRYLRDYTGELLETFWQVFFPRKEAVDFNETLNAHGRLFENVLMPLGLAVMEMDMSGGSQYAECKVQGSELLFQWIGLAP